MNNDLISREALKEALNTWDKFGYTAKSELIRLTSDNEKLYRPYIHYEDVINCIDNAPTVEAFTKEDMSGAYNEGYACGSRESERPKGEWLRTWNIDEFTCDKCRSLIKQPTLMGQPSYTFCPNCGAEMKGGAE